MSRDEWVIKIKENPLMLKDAPDEIKNDKRIVFEAILAEPHVFRYASSVLKNREDWIKPLMYQRPDALQYFSNEIKQNVHFLSQVFVVQGLEIVKSILKSFTPSPKIIIDSFYQERQMLPFLLPKFENRSKIFSWLIRKKVDCVLDFASLKINRNSRMFFKELKLRKMWEDRKIEKISISHGLMGNSMIERSIEIAEIELEFLNDRRLIQLQYQYLMPSWIYIINPICIL